MLEGVVAIPKDLVDDLIELMPKLVHADDRVKEDVQGGLAFLKHSRNIAADLGLDSNNWICKWVFHDHDEHFGGRMTVAKRDVGDLE